MKSLKRIVLGVLIPLSLLVGALPAQAAAPFCIPEAPVCAGLSGGTFVFTIQPAPGPLSLRATVNGAPTGGSYSVYTTPSALHGTFTPFPPLVAGDVICLTFSASGVRPGPYCDTMR